MSGKVGGMAHVVAGGFYVTLIVYNAIDPSAAKDAL